MKTIINGKLYDTETATQVAIGPLVEVYRTKKGNWFKRVRILYSDDWAIERISFEEAQNLVGLYNSDRYEKYFGRAEEA